MDNSNSMKSATSSNDSGSLFNSFFSSSAEPKPNSAFKLGSVSGSNPLPQSLYSGSSESNDSSWIIYLIGGIVLLSILGAISYYYYLQQQGKVPPMMQLGQSYLTKLSNQFNGLTAGSTAAPTTMTQIPTMTQSAEPVETQQQYDEQIEQQENELNQTLNSAQVETQVYEADESSSSIQGSKAGNKSGWCYIGEDRGFRSCIKVGEQDTCMSGDIFPSQDICVNPSLRQ